MQGLVYLASGKLIPAEQTARHLLQIARDGGLTLSQNYAHWLLGVVHYERNLLDEVVYPSAVVITNEHFVNFWAVEDAMYGLALGYQAQALSTKAQESGTDSAQMGRKTTQSERATGCPCVSVCAFSALTG